MKQHIIKLLASIVVTVTFVACSSSQDGANSHEGHNHATESHGMMNQSEPTKEVAAKMCPVSGEELGSMGEPVKVSHEGHEVKLCCQDCIKQFESDPTKYLAKLSTGSDHDKHTENSHSEHH